MSAPLPHRDFHYPLNALVHVLTAEEGRVDHLHYGLFAHAGESILAAQEHSTELLLERLPPPPCRVLDVGTGLGTTLARLLGMGYDAVGITPDPHQLAAARARHGDSLPVRRAAVESFEGGSFDVIVCQESAQYVGSDVLFARARELAPRMVVLDEFALRPLDEPGALHALDRFLGAAARHGFELSESVDLSARAAPTVRWFVDRLPSYRTRLVEDLGLASGQVDELVDSGRRYAERYGDGTYGYRLLALDRA